MKERGSHAGNVTTRQLQRVISLNSSELYMKKRSIHAVNTRQMIRVISLDTSELYIKERVTMQGL